MHCLCVTARENKRYFTTNMLHQGEDELMMGYLEMCDLLKWFNDSYEQFINEICCSFGYFKISSLVFRGLQVL